MRSIAANQIRLTYAHPPGHASTDADRRATYVAALSMYEQLLDAATAVSHFARPLPLFYALSQAGRAIIAAHGATAEAWGHGLAQGDVRVVPIVDATVKPTSKPGLFGAVSEVLGDGKAPLAAPVAIGELWAALADLADSPFGPHSWKPALGLQRVVQDHASPRALERASVAIVGIPAAQLATASAAQSFLAGYPHTDDLIVTPIAGTDTPAFLQTIRGPGLAARYQQTRESGSIVSVSGLDVGSIVPAHRYLDEWWLTPTIGVSLSQPLLIWWVLLFGLSIIARYEPATWRHALDLEQPLAVPLEDLLDEALRAIPHWLLWALTGHHLQLPRPPEPT